MISTDTTSEEQWLLKRWGTFSASQIHKILSKGVGEMFGAGAKSYIEEVAIESYTMFSMDENVESYAMKMGKVNEAACFGEYARLLNLPGMVYYGGSNPVFKEFDKDSGCSPDAVLPIDASNESIISFGAEFKNNQRKQHFKDLRLIADQYDIKKEHIDDYSQCQFSMMCYKVDLWHWVSRNEYFPAKDRMLIIEMKEDKPFQDNLQVRLMMAQKVKRRIIEQRMNDYKGEIDFKN